MNYIINICFIIALVLYNTSNVKAQELQDTMPAYQGEEVLFVGKKIFTQGAVTLTNTEFKKLAASFDDPSRLLIKYPGFSNDNDQANGVVYHGMPSHFNGWQLNGLDIVNPNHLSNAGTFTDQSSISAGGVNMFSGNVIDRFSFFTPFDAHKNSPYIGGSANISIKAPKQSFVQLSLLGLESGFNINKKNHRFFANLRYSFTGLLGDFGVDFGNEQIRFADGVVGYNYTSAKSNTSVIFSRGQSKNYHPMQSTATSVKDRLDIDYKSDIAVFEASHTSNFDNGNAIYFGLAYSTKNDENNILGIYPDGSNASNAFKFKHDLICLHQKFQFKQNLIVGIKELFNDHEINTNVGNYWSFLPYITKTFSINTKWDIETKVEALIQNKLLINPFIKLTYKNESNSISFIGNSSAQQLSFTAPSFAPSRATNFALNFKKEWSDISFQFNLFSHYVDHIAWNSDNNYSLFNTFDAAQRPDKADGRAFSRGFDVLVDYNTNKYFWVNANYTFFRAKQNDKMVQDVTWVNVENNFNYIGNVNVGKDWLWGDKKLSVSSSYHIRGGQYVFLPKLVFGNEKDYTSSPYTQLSPYSRLDLRINLSTPKYFLSLDIQNVMSKVNDAFLSYDLDGIQKRGQLGLLPVLSYKRYF